jgi:hypothetical protein
MVFVLRWRPIAFAGCLVFSLGTALLADGDDSAASVETPHRYGLDLLASRTDVLDADLAEYSYPPIEPPCSHGPCPSGFTSFFSGRRGVLSKYPDDSFVHIVFAGQLHHAWLKQLVSNDPRYWLFEELTPDKVHRRWAVGKWGNCPEGCHWIWYHQFEKPEDEDAFGDWKFVECAHKTCMELDAIPYPADLGPRPKDGDASGFEPREKETRTAKKLAAPKKIEQAPNAVEEKSPPSKPK